MKFKTNLKHELSLIDLTPLVDVIFLLLIFFLVTSNILPLKSLNVNAPTLGLESNPKMTDLLIVMDKHGVIYLGSKKNIVDFFSLKDFLQTELKNLNTLGFTQVAVSLKVDEKVDYASFLKLFSIVQEVNPQIRLVYKPNVEV